MRGQAAALGLLAAASIGSMAGPAEAQEQVICRDPQARSGDTLACGGRNVRLWGVRAPAPDETGFETSRAALMGMVRYRSVDCRVRDAARDQTRDRANDRLDLAECFVGGRNLGAEQVSAGHAAKTGRP